MEGSFIKNSGIVPNSDLQEGTTEKIKQKERNRGEKRIATWNVRSLLKCGKMENVKQEMKRLKSAIIGGSKVTRCGRFLDR